MFRLPRIEKHPTGATRFAGAKWLPPSPNGAEGPGFRIWMEGVPNYRYVIESSENTVDWIPLQTNLLGGSRLEIIDNRIADAAKRFYRARVAGF